MNRRSTDRETTEGREPDGQAEPPSWRGQEVAGAPDSEAEENADVAAGRVPGGRRGEDGGGLEETAPLHMAPDEEREFEELKRQAAVEEHEAEREEGTGTAPKNL